MLGAQTGLARYSLWFGFWGCHGSSSLLLLVLSSVSTLWGASHIQTSRLLLNPNFAGGVLLESSLRRSCGNKFTNSKRPRLQWKLMNMNLSSASTIRLLMRRRCLTCTYYYFFPFFLLRLLRPLLLFSIPFFSNQETLSSILQVNVWQRSQSKKKSKIEKPGSLRWSLSQGIIDEKKNTNGVSLFFFLLFIQRFIPELDIRF